MIVEYDKTSSSQIYLQLNFQSKHLQIESCYFQLTTKNETKSERKMSRWLIKNKLFSESTKARIYRITQLGSSETDISRVFIY